MNPWANGSTTSRASQPPTPYLAKLSHSWWVTNRLRMGVAGAFHGEGFQALPERQKIGWWRGRRGLLRHYARRLDGPPTVSAHVPRPGCWALTAVVGTQRSRFVVEVAPSPAG